MSVPRWKIWLSYLTELHLESISSEYNPHLYVSLNRGRFQLSTAHAVYSYGDLYTNFLRAFQQIDLAALPIRDVLVLGLGLGSIPLMLEKTFGRSYHYTVVEIDEEVIYLAGKYGLSELDSGIDLIQADALAFIAQSEETYDLICMDIFLDDAIPAHFEDREFLEDLRDRLNPGGILLYNRLAATDLDKRRSRSFYEKRFLEVFPQGACLSTGGNFILINQADVVKNTSGKE